MARAVTVAAGAIGIGPGEVFTGEMPGGASGLVIDAITLTAAPTGTLNLKDNALIVRQSPFSTIYGYVATGYNGGAWNGYGIDSSVAAADPNHLTGVGIINNAEAHYLSFEGHATTAFTESLVKFAFYGDANLDGAVDQLDVALMGTGTGWYHGDFNYSGTVDAADYALLNLNLQSGGPVVPEPGAMSLLLAGAAFVGARRTRRV